jgi:hypothetical protein
MVEGARSTAMVAFGIDLAGYTTGKTSLAVIEIKGPRAKATLLRDSALSAKRESDAALRDVLRQEATVLRRCLAVGPVAVDIPIDLQDLTKPDRSEYIWQLTRRPIDRALSAMAPLADRIGAPAARFAAIMREGDFDGLLGTKLFEAYPAGTLRVLGIKVKRSKDASRLVDFSSLCETLRIEPHVSRDDDFDAIICAIAAAAPTEAVYDAAALKVTGQLPKGFRIPKSLSFERIEVVEARFDSWIAERELVQATGATGRSIGGRISE